MRKLSGIGLLVLVTLALLRVQNGVLVGALVAVALVGGSHFRETRKQMAKLRRP